MRVCSLVSHTASCLLVVLAPACKQQQAATIKQANRRKQEGKKLEEAEAIKNTEIAQELALPPVKIHCSVLAEDAIKAAVKNIREKRGE